MKGFWHAHRDTILWVVMIGWLAIVSGVAVHAVDKSDQASKNIATEARQRTADNADQINRTCHSLSKMKGVLVHLLDLAPAGRQPGETRTEYLQRIHYRQEAIAIVAPLRC